MQKTKVTYIISNINKALEFEWVAEFIDRDKFELSFILLNPKKGGTLSLFIQQQGWEVYEIIYRGKKDLLNAFWQVSSILRKIQPNTVHTHLPEATLVGLLLGKWLKIPQRVYTRHHSTFNHDYHPHAVKYDIWSNNWATDIVAITDNVKKVLVEKERALDNKIKVIPHCIDIQSFDNVTTDRVEILRKKYSLDKENQAPVVGVISRYTEWKGIQYIIPAFKKLLEKYPKACLVLAGGKGGEYTEQIKKLLAGLPQNNYREIAFEEDLFALYKLFDVFVHTPIDEYCEAFGQIYVEAMAAKVPSIFTCSGIGYDIAKHEENCLVVPFKDSGSIFQQLDRLLKDRQLQQQLVGNAYNLVTSKFFLQKKIQELEGLYEK